MCHTTCVYSKHVQTCQNLPMKLATTKDIQLSVVVFHEWKKRKTLTNSIQYLTICYTDAKDVIFIGHRIQKMMKKKWNRCRWQAQRVKKMSYTNFTHHSHSLHHPKLTMRIMLVLISLQENYVSPTRCHRVVTPTNNSTQITTWTPKLCTQAQLSRSSVSAL